MKRILWIGAAMCALAVWCQATWALEGVKPYQINNRLRLEWDDNVYQSESEKVDSVKIIEEVELLLNVRLEQSFLSLRYRPSFVWWDNREPDDTDLQHELDVIANHAFSPRLALSLVDTFRRGELPELVDRDVLVREQDDFIYNTANGTLSYLLQPATRLDVAGRYVLLRYDRDETADVSDFDLLVGGLTLRHQLKRQTAVMADLRVEDIAYEGPDRDAQTYSVGGGVEQVFSPNLIALVTAGYQNKEFDADALGSDSSPYADLSLTFLPTPATRLAVGGGYSLYETDVYPFANQTRTRLYASLAHDFTARIALYLSGAYTLGEYDSQDAVESVEQGDGEEEIVQVSARATYKLNRSNWLEAGWQYIDLSSDYRVPYERNRISVGWKTQF